MHRAILPGELDNIVDYYELCLHCNEEVPIVLDAGDCGYAVTCPFCGAEMMLRTLCHDEGGACDWNDDKCFRQKEENHGTVLSSDHY